MPQNTSGGIQRDCKYEKENKKLHKVDLLYTAVLAKCLILWLKFLLITTFFNHSGKKSILSRKCYLEGRENYMTAYLLFFGPFQKSCLVFIFINYHFFCLTVK